MVINNTLNGSACKGTNNYMIYKAIPLKKLNNIRKSIMQDKRRLRIDRRTTTKNLLGRVFIDFTILTDYGVHTLGNVDRHYLTFRIEDNNDVAPVVTSGIVLQYKGDDTRRRIEEL